MKAVVIEQAGGPEVLRYREVPMPDPGPGQVRVRLRAAGVNHRDIWLRLGRLGAVPSGIVPGSDGAGEVDALGPGVSGFELRQRVVINPGISCGHCPECLRGDQVACPVFHIYDGTYAEYAVVPAMNLVPMPTGLTFSEAASVGVPFVTAEEYLSRAGVAPGHTVLLWGATGGLGLATVQLAKLRGARVIAVTRDPDKGERLKQELRVDEVLVWDGTSDLSETVRAMTGGAGVDVAIDSLGSKTFVQSLAATRRGGVVVTVGSTTGGQVTLDLGQLFRRRLTVLGAYMGSTAVLPRLLSLFARGLLVPVIDHVYPLEQADQAHEQLERSDIFGKVVLEI
ncbi:MAG: zinc-binding dehydrogenase [Firmicutes bacterium]|nr:zinc-binding dehydrogenase [Alicyclobacillaceae bacterium]MCL6496594.1 zinc-binding dehydrogenase [Bacillota bacterium]